MSVTPANSTYAYIERKIRRLTASSSESSLRSADIGEYVNNFYNQNFPNSIKTDQMRSVYTFYTSPYIDRYPVNVNYNQGFRMPMYVDGVQGNFFKDRDQFYVMWPRWPTRFSMPTATIGSVTAVLQPSNPTQITSPNHGLSTGDIIYITEVVGMVELNNNTYTITVINANVFSLNGVDNTLFTPYVSGGIWTLLTLTFTIGAVPFLSKSVTIGMTDINGNPIRIGDDGNGNLQLEVPNAQVSVPNQLANVPGMKNLNTQNPGDLVVTNIGSVNYVTGVFAINFSLVPNLVPSNSQTPSLFVSQYTTGRPYSMLFWNNEITIRPVPKLVHKIEIESYLTPVQFMLTTDNPIMNQWAKYIAYGAAIDILTDRQDFSGIENLMPAFKEQEGLVLERQGVEEIGQRNTTIFSASVQGQGNYWGSWGNWY